MITRHALLSSESSRHVLISPILGQHTQPRNNVERRNLGFVWVCTQIVGSVVVCEIAQRFFNSCFHFYERGLLSCDTQIVCVYEATCSGLKRLIVSVVVEKDGVQDTSLWQAVLLFSPSATLIVQFHI